MAQGKHTIPFSKPTGFLRGPAGPSVEEARQEMLKNAEAATTFRNRDGKVPEFIQQERAKSNRGQGGNVSSAGPVRQQVPDIVEETIENPPEPVRQAVVPVVQVPETVTVNTVQPEPARAPVVEPEPQRKRIDTKKFVGEYFREGKEWVAEIIYKNGSGTERFTAQSKDDLLLKVLEGKGHGTVKVRETVQRYKLGDIFDGWDIFMNEVKESHDLSAEEYSALPDKSRQLIQDTIQSAYILEFKSNYPEYYATAANFQKIGQYLNSRKVPMTLHNLELAFRDLSEDDILETRPSPTQVPPVPTAVSVTVPATVTPVEDSTVEVVPAPAVAATPAPVRKRASTTGIVPGQSSAVPSLETPAKTEDGTRSAEPSEQELREARDAATRGDFTLLKRIATKDRKYGARY